MAHDLADPLAETLAVFDGRSSEPLTASEVAGALGTGGAEAASRLTDLEHRGVVASKQVDDRRVWWRTDGDPDARPEVADALDAADAGVVLLDADHEIAWANGRVLKYLGLDREEVVGREAREFVTRRLRNVVADHESFAEEVLDTYEGDATDGAVAFRVLPGDDVESRWLEHRSRAIESGPHAGGRVDVYLDVTKRETGRRARERDREEYERILDTVEDGIYVLDADGRFTAVNEAFVTMTGYDRESLVGVPANEASGGSSEGSSDGGSPDEQRESVGAPAETVFEDEFVRIADEKQAEADGVVTLDETLYPVDGEPLPVETKFTRFDLGDDGTGRVGVVRDVTEHKEHERELERYETLAQTASDVIVSIDANSVIRRVNPAVEDVFGYEPGELESEPLTTLIPERLVDDHHEGMLQYLRTGERTLDWDLVELPGVHADGTEIPLAISFSEYVHDGERYFTGIIRDVTERTEREDQLERRREQLEALDDLNAVVRSVTDAVVEQSTSEEIEATVCETIAASDAYSFAWIAGDDTPTGRLEPRAEAGTRGYLEDVEVSGDPDDPTGQGPTGRAIRTGELQVVRDVTDAEAYDPWHEAAREYGFRASAAIPVTHDETMYGVLNVYTDRAGAFADEERDVVGQLGEVVGHAIAAVERKRALMSDEVVEVEFAIEDAFEYPDEAARPGGTVTVDRVVPAGDDIYLVYGVITGTDVGALDGIVDASPGWETVTVLDERDDRSRFELRLSEPPMLSTVAAQGGQIQEAYIEDGDMRLTVHLPPSVDVRRVTEVVQDVHPGAALMTRRQVTRESTARERLERVLDEELTERQRGALEAAFFAGFFEWPRDASGEDVADALGVTPPTFHQHVRAAERKLLEALFEESASG